MDCPIDGTTLAIADRQGVEIDYCPKCRGVWLDRGELDKLLEREGAGERWDRDAGRWARWDDDTPPPGLDPRTGQRRRHRGLFDMFDFD